MTTNRLNICHTHIKKEPPASPRAGTHATTPPMPTMQPIRRPCLDCHNLTTETSRCGTCQAKREQQRNQNRPHYDGDYGKRAAQVRANARTCWLCGEAAKPDDPWTADHVIPSDPNSPLLPAHRSCNSRRGDAKGKRGEHHNMERR